MKTKLLFLCLAVLSVSNKNLHAQNGNEYITAFEDTLRAVSSRTDNEFFKIHCQSMIDVINAKAVFSSDEVNFLNNTYLAFNDETDNANAKRLSTYLRRKRPFILSWKSPADGQVSFTWVTPPINWDPAKSYPLYVQLHGLWEVAANTIQYMTYPYLNVASTSYAFEDGFLLSPWGRGNLWYEGISETDIWEGMAALEKHVSIDPTRKYLCGMSMGGYGTWHIARNSAHTWAAIGLHSAALRTSPIELGSDAVNALKNVPTFFICGMFDGLLSINQNLYQAILSAGNRDVMFVTFRGGHDYRQTDVETMYSWMHVYVNRNVSTGIEAKTTVPTSTVNAFPNPFYTTTLIKYNLPKSGKVTLEIYNNQGWIVKKIEYAQQVAGDNEISWTPENLSSGVYYYCLTTEYSRCTNRIMYIK